MKRKIIATLLTLCMIFSILPVAAFAADAEPVQPTDLESYKVIAAGAATELPEGFPTTNAGSGVSADGKLRVFVQLNKPVPTDYTITMTIYSTNEANGAIFSSYVAGGAPEGLCTTVAKVNNWYWGEEAAAGTADWSKFGLGENFYFQVGIVPYTEGQVPAYEDDGNGHYVFKPANSITKDGGVATADQLIEIPVNKPYVAEPDATGKLTVTAGFSAVGTDLGADVRAKLPEILSASVAEGDEAKENLVWFVMTGLTKGAEYTLAMKNSAGADVLTENAISYTKPANSFTAAGDKALYYVSLNEAADDGSGQVVKEALADGGAFTITVTNTKDESKTDDYKLNLYKDEDGKWQEGTKGEEPTPPDPEQPTLTVAPSTADDLLGKSAADLQGDVKADGLKVSGISKYVTGYTGFNGAVEEEQEGNYIALVLTSSDGKPVWVLSSDSTKWTKVDESDNTMVLLLNKYTDKLITVAISDETPAADAETLTLDLTGVTLQAKTEDADSPNVIGIGFKAVAADAEVAIANLGGYVTDCEANTMFVRFNGLDNTKQYKVVFSNSTGKTVYDSSVKAGGVEDIISGTKTATVYFTFTGVGSVAVQDTLASDIFTATLQEKKDDQWESVTVTGTQSVAISSVKYTLAADETAADPLPEETYYEVGTDVTMPAAPTKAGYIFQGWKVNDAETPIAAGETYTTTKDAANVTATWESDKIESAVLCAADGRTLVSSATVNVTTDGANSKLTISGAIPAAGTYKLQYTAASETTGTVTVTVAESKQKITVTADPVVIGAYTYTVEASELNIVKIEAAAPTVNPIPADAEMTSEDKAALETLFTDPEVIATSSMNALVAHAAADEELMAKFEEAKVDPKKEYTVEVYLEVTPKGYSSADKVVTLEITPMARLAEVDNGVNTPVAGTEAAISNFKADEGEEVLITVKLPSGFAEDGDVANIYVKHGSEFIAPKDGASKDSITFKASSFSEYQVVLDSRSVTVSFDGGEHTVSLKPSNIGGLIQDPAPTQDGKTFSGWALTESATSAKYAGNTLTEAIFSQMVEDAKDAEGNLITLNLYPVFTSGGGSSNPGGSSSKPTTPTKPTNPTQFVDVPAGAYYTDAVKWAVEKGITTGMTDTTFAPNADCTRAQMVTFLWRAAGSPKAEGENPFTDVAAGAYYYDAVLWAVSKGITKGTSDTTFTPDDIVSRAQTVTFLHRYAGAPEASGNSFTDVTAGSYYEGAVDWAVAEGVTQGTSDTTFSPDADCVRAQIVTFLYRYMVK